MAHSCPICDSYCTCGGDIDDMQLDETEYTINCTHCTDDLDFDEDPEMSKTEACARCGKMNVLTQTELEGVPGQKLCYECCGEEGFCYGCGNFSAGTTEFDLSEMGYYCENCQDQIHDGIYDWDDGNLEDWEYPF